MPSWGRLVNEISTSKVEALSKFWTIPDLLVSDLCNVFQESTHGSERGEGPPTLKLLHLATNICWS